MPNYYEILGVENTAPVEDIKKAWKKLALKYHPDVCSDENAEEKIKEINEAYEHLSDPQKRSQYDMQLSGNPFGNNPFGNNPFGNDPFGWNMASDIGNMFRQQPRVRPNSHIQVKFPLNLSKVNEVNEIDIKYAKQIQCDKCHGNGGIDAEICPTCKGQGMINHTVNHGAYVMFQTIPCSQCHGKKQIFKTTCNDCRGFGFTSPVSDEHFTLPVGSLWRRYTLKNKGNQENTSMPAGDLLIDVIPESNSEFKIENHYHVVAELHLDPVEAMLGGDYSISSFDGTTCTVTIPEGCTAGYREVIKEKGISMNEFQKGNFVVEVIYRVPNVLSEKQKNALKQYIIAKSEEDKNDNV